MSKQEFLAQLGKGLSGLPQGEAEERLTFYSEMIDDRMEEGMSEEDAVDQIGNVDEIISQIIADVPLAKLVKEKVQPKRSLRVWEILLLALGSPIWLSLLIAALAVFLSGYVVIWAVIISLWAVEVSFLACALSCIVAGVGFTCSGNRPSGIALIGAGLVCAGISIFLFFGCKMVTKGIFRLTGRLATAIKNRLLNRGKHHG